MTLYPIAEKQQNGVLILSLILLFSLFIRIFFFNGEFGSDEVVYLIRSLDVTNWHWSSSNYNGALRYGYNIPSGLFIYLFGLNMFTANLWPLLCSLVEISLVFLFSWKYINHKAALFSALLLAFLPLHVAVSTRLHADPVVSMFLTLSFVSFYKAELESSRRMYFLTGIFLGCVFWVKELVSVTFFTFLLYPIFIRKIKWIWLYLVSGALVMLLTHFALMEFIAGDPLHAITTVMGQMKRGLHDASRYEDSPLYYFKYLFFDIKHTWLTPLLALLAIPTFSNSTTLTRGKDGLKYAIFWLVSLLVVLSFFPVSLAPLRFAMKQSNYITLFLAPIAIIAGAALTAIPRKIAYLLTAITLSGGLFLSALEQQDYRVFTANSRALLVFSDNHPNQDIYGSVNNGRIGCFHQVINGKDCNSSKIHNFTEIPTDTSVSSDTTVFAVIDRETLDWGIHDKKISNVPTCWHEIETIVPASIGNSHFILDIILMVTKLMPTNVARKFEELQNPKPAKIYTTTLANIWCDSADKKSSSPKSMDEVDPQHMQPSAIFTKIQ
ncbi:MAG: hypothetical protein COZ20_00110 [Gallionellales bacterium CG_4_10_14_3_um_filter_54_96]|nr:MAG: hypothetical protein COW45_07785 [Gallionellales bacterium CG17_big_fil_post_rev_8_21_14_2_50_54_146]PIX03798.1 MAG: hypothetical protein COZ77_09825 [Gallionellales bacterium CG_4_8_14_3_um_filter_54_18]PIY07156.1 MAG: hypothetical protein COZ20_00110 [Gallionellales bacterium CG_4_10_14_3_um_filter_54_96]